MLFDLRSVWCCPISRRCDYATRCLVVRDMLVGVFRSLNLCRHRCSSSSSSGLRDLSTLTRARASSVREALVLEVQQPIIKGCLAWETTAMTSMIRKGCAAFSCRTFWRWCDTFCIKLPLILSDSNLVTDICWLVAVSHQQTEGKQTINCRRSSVVLWLWQF